MGKGSVTLAGSTPVVQLEELPSYDEALGPQAAQLSPHSVCISTVRVPTRTEVQIEPDPEALASFPPETEVVVTTTDHRGVAIFTSEEPCAEQEAAPGEVLSEVATEDDFDLVVSNGLWVDLQSGRSNPGDLSHAPQVALARRKDGPGVVVLVDAVNDMTRSDNADSLVSKGASPQLIRYPFSDANRMEALTYATWMGIAGENVRRQGAYLEVVGVPGRQLSGELENLTGVGHGCRPTPRHPIEAVKIGWKYASGDVCGLNGSGVSLIDLVQARAAGDEAGYQALRAKLPPELSTIIDQVEDPAFVANFVEEVRRSSPSEPAGWADRLREPGSLLLLVLAFVTVHEASKSLDFNQAYRQRFGNPKHFWTAFKDFINWRYRGGPPFGGAGAGRNGPTVDVDYEVKTEPTRGPNGTNGKPEPAPKGNGEVPKEGPPRELGPRNEGPKAPRPAPRIIVEPFSIWDAIKGTAREVPFALRWYRDGVAEHAAELAVGSATLAAAAWASTKAAALTTLFALDAAAGTAMGLIVIDPTLLQGVRRDSLDGRPVPDA